MTEEDDVFFKIMNEKREPSNRITEDQFEEVMYFFEETAQTKQPFAAVDSPPVLSFAEMQDSMDATVEESVKCFAKDIYEHWKLRRIATGNRPLLPSLKVSRPHRMTPYFPRLTMSSLKLVKIPMIQTRMSAFVGVKSVRFGRPAAEMPKVPTNCADSERSWKMLDSWLHWCASGSWQEKRCSRWSDRYSCNVPR